MKPPTDKQLTNTYKRWWEERGVRIETLMNQRNAAWAAIEAYCGESDLDNDFLNTVEGLFEICEQIPEDWDG